MRYRSEGGEARSHPPGRRLLVYMKKIMFLIGFVLVMISSSALAMDTDLYVLTNADVPPNVMIMFDNSGSMNDPMTGELYNPAISYPFVATEQPNAVFYIDKGQSWNLYRDTISEIDCEFVRTALSNEGFYTGKIQFQTSACGSGTNVTLRVGNFMNYLQISGGSSTQPRLGIAKGIIQSYINTTEGVRFGAMVFNPVVTIGGESESEGGRILKPVLDMAGPSRSDLHTAIGGLHAETWTPLAETLYEAGLYFQGKSSHFNPGTTYTSPIQNYCQRNYVILITDGESTKDRNSVLKSKVDDYDGDEREPGWPREVPYADNGTDYLDDVAKQLYDADFFGETVMKNQQNLTTYTIGFAIDSPLLRRTAEQGGGKYFYCYSAQSFIVALQTIINDILAKSTSFVAPVVPISQMERTSAGDRIYLAMFKPTAKSFWKGNIKKYRIATENEGAIKKGDILDADGNLALDKDAKIKGTARSFWSSEEDGEDVERGGVGEILKNRDSARNIYTYLGESLNLTDSSNHFVLSNSLITPSSLGVPNNPTGRDKLINFIHGLDSYDENGNKNTIEKRGWILGGFVHSRPLIIHYGLNQSVIYVGGNDGMLHAFDDASGEELWGFIPPNLLPRLKNLEGETLESFVDGAPKAYVGPNNDQIILVFGQRRGGDCYHALDVTDPDSPKFLWEISPSREGFQELGQTWSTPHIGKIQDGSDGRWVVFFGGGYDTNQDRFPPVQNDIKGRAVYVADLFTGSHIWSYTYTQNASMNYCIPGDLTRVDITGHGKVERVYAGDLGGRLWRFDVSNADPTDWTANMIFTANPGASDHRKLFYPPDVTLERDSVDYEMLFFGTGDRENPKEPTVINRLYAVKDKNPPATLGESDLVDVTSDLLQDPNSTQAQKDAMLSQLSTKSGWLIKLDQNSGEKVLAPPVVYYRTVYYSTFSPTIANEPDPCLIGLGKGRLYILAYTNGNAAFNLDPSNDVSGEVVKRSDRSGVIGAAIPSGVVVTFIGGTAVGYVGIGGGVFVPKLPTTRSLAPINWKLVF